MDEQMMRRALRLARRGAGHVEPNPMVGCVIVRRGRVVGEGWHRRFGAAHAEVEALRAAGARARGATVYVTLEPCAHHGKTPPCTEALIAAGVKRVVVGCVDPNPVSGGGRRKLKRAGVDVQTGVLAEEAAELIAPFTKRVRTGLPYVICKWAATVDGAIATASGDSQWISNERSRRIVHQLRGRVDAIIVGIGTVLADDPWLTARDVRVRRVARRVVIDPDLKLPLDCRLVRSVDVAPLTVAAGEKGAGRSRKCGELEKRGVELVVLTSRSRPSRASSSGQGKRQGHSKRTLLNMRRLMTHMVKAHSATNVLVEGGAGTHGAMLDQRLVDELMVFTGPKVLGDGAGMQPVRSPGSQPVRRMRDATIGRLVELRRIGDDVLGRYRLDRS